MDRRGGPKHLSYLLQVDNGKKGRLLLTQNVIQTTQKCRQHLIFRLIIKVKIIKLLYKNNYPLKGEMWEILCEECIRLIPIVISYQFKKH